jgi:hypothetical protein
MAMSLQHVDFLDEAIPGQREQWCQYWQAWPEREVFAHPDYLRLFAQPRDRVMCATLDSAGGVLFPFLLRPLVREPWAPAEETTWDLVGPYGYGGAFAWSCSEEDAVVFWKEFEAWAKTQRLVSSFVRLSLFPDQQIPFCGQITEDRPNIVRSLDLTPEALWQDFEHKVRKNVNSAKRSGLRVEIDFDGRRLDEFLKIYYSTMERREASDSYYFPTEFFNAVVRQLAGQYAFFFVLDEGKVVSAELVLVSVAHIYSFLGGTLAEAFAKRPNDLLKHEIILWARQAGKRAFVLGGGYSGDDGIYRYKRSFAPGGSRPFCVGRQIHDAAAYDRLLQQRAIWEGSRGNAWKPKLGYFTEYRA